MPYTQHRLCFEPDENHIIWRYMDFAQFVWLIKRDRLFFPRADMLDDPYEGTLPRSHQLDRANSEEIPKGWAKKILPEFREICKKFTYLSCWQINTDESAAMWDLYLDADYGVCIQSTVERLKDSFRHDKRDIHLSEVNYIDFSKHHFAEEHSDVLASSIGPFLHKRNNYKYESELRAIIHNPTWRDSTGDSIITAEEIQNIKMDSESLPKDGQRININKNRLIESIYVSPNADGWVEPLLRDLLDDHGIDPDKLDSSPMAEPPSF